MTEFEKFCEEHRKSELSKELEYGRERTLMQSYVYATHSTMDPSWGSAESTKMATAVLEHDAKVRESNAKVLESYVKAGAAVAQVALIGMGIAGEAGGFTILGDTLRGAVRSAQNWFKI